MLGEDRPSQPHAHLRVVSAKSSFLRFIRSFKFSASRRAVWIRDCIASGDTSFDMLAAAAVDGPLRMDQKELRMMVWLGSGLGGSTAQELQGTTPRYRGDDSLKWERWAIGICRSWTARSQLRRDGRGRNGQLMAQGDQAVVKERASERTTNERTSKGAADLEVPAAAKRNRASRVAYPQCGLNV